MIKRFGWALSIALCCATMFVGCSDDDDNDDKKTEIEGGTGTDDKESGTDDKKPETDDKEPGTDNNEPETGGKISPSNVFTGKLPESYAGSAVTYNEEGLVAKIVNGDKEVTFTYPSATTKASNAKQVVRMTIYDSYYPEEGKMYFDMTIGDSGYAESCKETHEKDSDIETWEFGYNSDGQLNYMMRSDNDNRKTKITYANGDITNIEETSDLNKHDAGTLSYGVTPIENKGCIMLFSEVFGIDMDDMKFAYLAGLLGKATKHLPVLYTDESDDGGGSEYSFEWKLDSNSYPTSMTSDGYDYLFSWQ